MWEKICLTGLFGLLWAVGLWLASRDGNKAAKLAALKEEIKKRAEEQERYNAINNSVDNRSIDDVRERLSNLKSK